MVGGGGEVAGGVALGTGDEPTPAGVSGAPRSVNAERMVSVTCSLTIANR